MLKINKIFLVYLIIFLATLIFFSYKLEEVPPGLTIDEAAFGYNAVLLSETLADETGRPFPVFALSIMGRDWRQPVTQYFMAGFFRILGPSIFNLRFTSVIVASISAVLLYYLGSKLQDKGAIASLIFFATTPIIMIHSHLGLDNIMPVPFTILWLIGLLLFEKTKSLKYLILAGVSLGIGFYAHKSMRVFVPTWSALTLIYLILPHLKKLSKKNLKPALIFFVSIIPFYAVIPLLEYKYAGAVLGQANIGGVNSVYQFMRSYLASFDPSFLFITGDELPHHSTGRHGMFLLASAPFFFLGLYKAFERGRFWILIVAAFLLGPLLFGFPGSIHRASRMLALVPLYVLIASLGAVFLWNARRKYRILLAIFTILLAVNSYDFLSYYWNSYARDNYHIFYSTDLSDAYEILKEESEKRGLTPYVDAGILNSEETLEGYPNKFLRSMHFVYPPASWDEGATTLPDNAILMTNNGNLEGLEKLETSIANFYFYIP